MSVVVMPVQSTRRWSMRMRRAGRYLGSARMLCTILSSASTEAVPDVVTVRSSGSPPHSIVYST